MSLFKKISETELIVVENKISYPDGTVITVADHANATGEVYDGWYWFNSREEAKAALGVSDPVLPEGPEFPTPPTP